MSRLALPMVRAGAGSTVSSDGPRIRWIRPGRAAGDRRRATDDRGGCPRRRGRHRRPRRPAQHAADRRHGRVVARRTRRSTRCAPTSFFEGFISANPGLESALVRNTATGEFMIFQGNASEVGFSTLDEAVRELVPESRSGSGRWVTESAQPPGLIRRPARRRSATECRRSSTCSASPSRPTCAAGAASEGLRFQTETGSQTSRFGYDPSSSEPITVDVPGRDGSPTPRRFATIDDYHDSFEGQFGFSPGEIPADFPGARRVDAEVTGGSAARTWNSTPTRK